MEKFREILEDTINQHKFDIVGYEIILQALGHYTLTKEQQLAVLSVLGQSASMRDLD